MVGRDQEWQGCLAHQLPRGACTAPTLTLFDGGIVLT